MERDCAESQSRQYRWLALTPNLLRLVLRTHPRSWPTAKFADNLCMHCHHTFASPHSACLRLSGRRPSSQLL